MTMTENAPKTMLSREKTGPQGVIHPKCVFFRQGLGSNSAGIACNVA